MGCYFLLQGIFLTHGSNQDLLHCRQILYQLSYQGCKWPFFLCPLMVSPPQRQVEREGKQAVWLLFFKKIFKICLFYIWLRLSSLLCVGFLQLLEKEMATHSSTLAWKIPWTEEPGRLQSMGSQRVRHNWATNTSFLPYFLSSSSRFQLGDCANY